MARIRTIKPEFPQSESMGRVSRDARLLFIMLWTIADDSGRLRGNSRMLASLLYPYDDDARGLIDGWLAELSEEGCIACYRVGGDSYVEVCNWLNHQKIDKPSKSKIPEFAESSRILANPREHSSGDQGPRTEGMDQGSRTGPDSSLANANDPSAIDRRQTKRRQEDVIPCQDVVDAYNTTCGDLYPQVQRLTDKRRKAIRSRWLADTNNPEERKRTNSLDYWQRYFSHCRGGIRFFQQAASGESRGDHAGWRPDFDFLMTERAWLGVKEGKYQ